MATRTVRTIDIDEFRRRCLALIDEVFEKHIEVIVTKAGKPIARVIPFDERA